MQEVKKPLWQWRIGAPIQIEQAWKLSEDREQRGAAPGSPPTCGKRGARWSNHARVSRKARRDLVPQHPRVLGLHRNRQELPPKANDVATPRGCQALCARGHRCTSVLAPGASSIRTQGDELVRVEDTVNGRRSRGP